MHKYTKEARSLLALVIPVIIAQSAQTGMGFVDTVMAGRYHPTDMAAVAVGTSIWLPTVLFGHGLLLALTPVIAQFNGAGKRERIAHQINQGFWIAISISLIVMFVLYNAQFIINRMHNIDPLLAEKAIGFLHAMMWGAPGFLLFQLFRNQCEGLAKTKPGMFIVFAGLLVNIPINYIFIYGKFGMPELGGVGCGVASASVCWVMFFMMFFYVRRASSQRDIVKGLTLEKPNFATLRRLLSLGLPVGLSLFFEVTLFAVVALLVSPLGVTAVGGHQVALNFSSLTFVFPLSFGVAAAIRVGQKLGEGSPEGARISAQASLTLGLMVSVFTAILTIVFREEIARFYTQDPSVIAVATQLLMLAAFYQCSDAIQVVGNGVLRGYKDTRSIFFITLFSYWFLGLPSGYLLGLTDFIVPRMGPSGFWCGFIIGLTAAAILVVFRLRWLQSQPNEKILARTAQ